jgi:hypothetical protein
MNKPRAKNQQEISELVGGDQARRKSEEALSFNLLLDQML